VFRSYSFYLISAESFLGSVLFMIIDKFVDRIYCTAESSISNSDVMHSKFYNRDAPSSNPCSVKTINKCTLVHLFNNLLTKKCEHVFYSSFNSFMSGIYTKTACFYELPEDVGSLCALILGHRVVIVLEALDTTALRYCLRGVKKGNFFFSSTPNSNSSSQR
jgi:hypothetical protein